MTKEEKEIIIEELKEKFAANPFFYITNAGGMTVESINKFRRLCFEKGFEYKVYKNTLIKKALVQTEGDYSEFFDKSVLKGASGIIFATNSGSEPAKMLKSFRQQQASELPILKGASIAQALYIGDNMLETLTKVKGKQEMLAELLGMLQSPASRLVSALKSGGAKVAGVLKTLSEKE
ncbi:MAG: 50S ribosomal protein L10 [Cytophagales bacterium]|nr:MAG: 50S ribosomal protein L10 [Cytophagales bacterium]